MPSGRPDVLLVIPAYREYLRLPAFLKQLVEQLSPGPLTIEILIVDDGSPASEQRELLQSVKNVGSNGFCRVLEPLFYRKNEGKGYAILSGWRSGRDAQWQAFVDADGAVPPHEVGRLLGLAGASGPNGASLFASRIQMPGRKINRRLSRHLSGRLFATLVDILFDPGIYDTQCGFKIIPLEIFRQIDPLLSEPGLCFDIELMLALRHVGADIREVPIDWEDKAGGRVRVWRHSWGMIRQLFRLRQRQRDWKKLPPA